MSIELNNLAYPKGYIKYMLMYIILAHPIPIIYAYKNKYYFTGSLDLLLISKGL